MKAIAKPAIDAFYTVDEIADALDLSRKTVDRMIKDGRLPAFPWAITKRDEEVLLGVVELHVTPPKAEIAYILREAAWGNGFAYEAAAAVSAWALEQPSLFRLWATCHPDNQASIRVLQKLGLHHEATLQNWVARPQLEEIAGASLMFARMKKL